MNFFKRGARFLLWLFHGIRGRIHRGLFRLRLHIFGSSISDRDYRRAQHKNITPRQERPPFFIDSQHREVWTAFFSKNYPGYAQHITQVADTFLAHEFDLLGSGRKNLGSKLPWHTDFTTGYSWPLVYWADIQYWASQKDIPYDIKVPWELSRFQWLPTLGQAYWFTQDPKYAREFVDLIDDWIQKNPPEMGPNWCVSMEVAIRATNWLTGYYYFADAPELDGAFLDRFFKMLLAHGRHLMNHLEVSEAPGNHYVSDGAGLVFLGLLLPEFKESTVWLAKGKEIILGELERQILPDGVDYEMSTSYHRLMFELFGYSLFLLEKYGEKIHQKHLDRLEKMLEFVMAYTRPDGTIAQVGDNDNGRFIIWTPQSWQALNDHCYLLGIGGSRFQRADMKRLAGELPPEAVWVIGETNAHAYRNLSQGAVPPSQAFPTGGFYSWRSEDRYLLIRHGGVGRLGFGGHSHNDVASFEYFHHEPILVDPGTGTYTAQPEVRNSFRSTLSHNTVMIDHQEMRPLSKDNLFTLISTRKPQLITWENIDHHQIFSGSHDEYQRLGVHHQRSIKTTNKGLQIHDLLSGDGTHTLSLAFNFSPDIKLDEKNDTILLQGKRYRGTLSWRAKDARIIQVQIRLGRYSSGYGLSVNAPQLVLQTNGSLPIEIETEIEEL